MLKFITRVTLPSLRIHTKKVSSTVHNIASAIQKIYGASATVNTETLPLKLTTIEHPDTPIKSLLALSKYSRKAIHTKDCADARTLLLKTLKDHSDYRVIIDAGSFFRDLRNDREIASLIFQQTEGATPPVDAVSYYDQEGENWLLMRPKSEESLGAAIPRSQCDVPLDRIFVFIRQHAPVGADTPMAITAKALVTVDPSIQRDLFFQGIGRMRNIDKDQRVGFLLHEKDSSAFKNEQGELSLDKILSVISQNQGEQRGQDLVFNLRLLLYHLVKKQFWDYFDDLAHSLDDSRHLFNALSDFLVEDTQEDPLDSLTQVIGNIPMEQAVKQMKDQLVRKVTPLITPEIAPIINLKRALQSFDELVDYKKLPETVNMRSAGESDRAVDVDVQAESAESEQQSEAACGEQQSEQAGDASSNLPSPGAFLFQSIGYQETYVDYARNEKSALGSQFSSKFSPLLAGIYASKAYLKMDMYEGLPQGIIKTPYQYVLIGEGGKLKVVFVDQVDAKAMVNETHGKWKQDNRDYYLMSLGDELITERAKTPFSSTPWATQGIPCHLSLMIKIFSQNWNFNQAEVDYLASVDVETTRLYLKFLDHMVGLWPPFAPHMSALQKRVSDRKKSKMVA